MAYMNQRQMELAAARKPIRAQRPRSWGPGGPGWQQQQGLPSNAGTMAQAPPPAPPTAPPKAPGAPGAPIATNAIPGEGVYQQDQANAQRAYDDAMSSLRAKEQGIQQQFGFNPQGGVDGLNMTSGYFQLKNSQAAQLMQAREQAIGRGLGGRGLGAQIQDAPRYEQGVQDAEFQRNYLGLLGEVGEGRNSASRTLNDALAAARWRQINSAVQNEQWSTPGEAQQQAPPPSAARDKLTAAVTQQMYKPVTVKARKAAAAAKKKGIDPRSAALNAMYGLGGR
jgi:hypothetical protein